MRKRKHSIKIPRASQRTLVALGGISMAGMGLFTIMAINPIIEKAYAANGWEQNLLNYEPAPAAVTLTMNSGENAMIRGGDGDAGIGVVKRTANLSVGSTSGYTVYIRANSANLTGSSSSNTIPSITSNSTLSQMTDKWGWNGKIDGTEGDCDLLETFKSMTTDNQELGRGGAASNAIDRKITMCFGTRVSGAKAADTYSNTVTVSVVAEPGQSSTRTFSGITTMQQMSLKTCNEAAYNDTAYLKDTRDGKYYWVTKLLDGTCWMSQNLDLDLGSSVTAAEPGTGDTFTWNNPEPTTTNLAVGTTNSTGTRSWDLGMYVLNTPTAATKCPDSDTGLAACSGQGFVKVGSGTSYPSASNDPNFYRKTSYLGTDGTTSCTKNANTAISAATSGVCAQYDAHYLVGNYYQWNAATAGKGGTITNTSAAGSICPQNWKIPGGVNDIAVKDTYAHLLSLYGVNSSIVGASGVNNDAYDIALSPLFFVRSGVITPGANVSDAGISGYYWTSRADSDTYYALRFLFTANSVKPSTWGDRHGGLSLRCVYEPHDSDYGYEL